MTWLKDKIARAGTWPLLILFVVCLGEQAASLGQEAKMQDFIQRLQQDKNVTASICRVYASVPIPARFSPEVFQTIKASLCAP